MLLGWSHSALAQSQAAGSPCVCKLIFGSFLTKTKSLIKPSQVTFIVNLAAQYSILGFDRITRLFVCLVVRHHAEKGPMHRKVFVDIQSETHF